MEEAQMPYRVYAGFAKREARKLLLAPRVGEYTPNSQRVQILGLRVGLAGCRCVDPCNDRLKGLIRAQFLKARSPRIFWPIVASFVAKATGIQAIWRNSGAYLAFDVRAEYTVVSL